jgi:hypothetical protein
MKGSSMSWGGQSRGKGKGIAFLRTHVDYRGEGCLLWPFGRNEDGYGQLGFDGKTLKAHRWMCEAVKGPPPSSEHYAAHDCGNGHLGCIHPEHLDWKTHAENTDDYIRDGRTRHGKGRRLRKLSHEQVQILLNPPVDKTIMQLSQEFGISYRHAKKIRQGKSWRDGLPRKTGTNAVHHGLIQRG